MKNGFDYKSDRHRISSADSSTPTVVEGQDNAEGKDIGKNIGFQSNFYVTK